jgi:hypothetical protein
VHAIAIVMDMMRSLIACCLWYIVVQLYDSVTTIVRLDEEAIKEAKKTH